MLGNLAKVQYEKTAAQDNLRIFDSFHLICVGVPQKNANYANHLTPVLQCFLFHSTSAKVLNTSHPTHISPHLRGWLSEESKQRKLSCAAVFPYCTLAKLLNTTYDF